MKRFLLSDMLNKAYLLCLSLVVVAFINVGVYAQSTDTRPSLGGLTVRLVPRITKDLDSVYLDIKVNKLGQFQALGDADFAFTISGVRFNDASQSPLVDTTTFPNTANLFQNATVRRGLWDQSRNPDFLPMTISRGMRSATGEKYFVVHVRKSNRSGNPGTLSIIPQDVITDKRNPLFERDPANVITIGFKIDDCKGRLGFGWAKRRGLNRLSNEFIGYINPYDPIYKFDVNYLNDGPLSNISINPQLRKPSLSPASDLPQSVLFSWGVSNPNATGFRINIFRKGVKILSKTLTIRTYEYRFFTYPKDSVCAVVYALNTYCKQDSIASDTICGNSRECAVFGLTRANISRDTSICPTSSATIRLDTASLFDSLVNDQRLGKNPEFSADSGKTWQRSPNFTVSRPSKNVTSLFITYRDANRCISGAVVEAKVSLLRYTPGTGVSIVGQSEICNRNRNDLSLTKTGDNLTYTWSVIKGFGGFTTPTGTVSSLTADVASYKPGVVPGSDTLELGTITIAARNSCFDIYDTFSFILTKAPIGVFVVNPASLKGPGVVLAGKAITFDVIGGLPGETYTWNFDDGTPVVTSSSVSQTHTFEATGIVTVKLTVLGSNGCSTDVFLKITITTESITGKSIFFIPNAFAPNSVVDGVTDNTKFKVYGDVNGNKPFEMKIFDGWGKLVYTMNSSSATWDGSSGGNLLPAGNYTYTVKCTLRDGTEINQNGTVSLIN